jgi:hypothetical protein
MDSWIPNPDEGWADTPTWTDSGVPDLGGGPCTNQCGDLTGDGDFDPEDTAMLATLIGEGSSVVVTEECWSQAGDVYQNGVLTQADLYLLKALQAGTITVGCLPCSGQCGDANNDGVVDVNDVQLIQSFILGQMSFDACQYWASDVKGEVQVPGGPSVADGVVNVIDIIGINAHIMNGATLYCAPVE